MLCTRANNFTDGTNPIVYAWARIEVSVFVPVMVDV